MIYTSPEISFPHYDFQSYRIELDHQNPRKPLQRHIWTARDGSISKDNWIQSSFCRREEDLLAKGYKRMIA